MKQRNYIRYFRVYKDDTSVTEISTNDFQRLKLIPFKRDWLEGDTGNVRCAIGAVQYTLPPDGALFYGYSSRAKAMEMAKAGALKHINLLIDQGESGEKALYQYRFDHYEDLTVNLVDANIRRIKNAGNAKAAKDAANQRPS